jgi:hypothetical protein
MSDSDLELDTADAVVTALGGNPAVAALVGDVKPSAVSNWRRSRGFPPRTYTVLTDALAARGLQAPASLWKMTEAKAS